MTVDAGNVPPDRAGLETLRRRLGAHLAMYRGAAGVSQPELARAIGRTRSMVSRIEHGTRTMPEALWAITDEMCRAEGALLAEHHALADAERDYHAQCRQVRQAEALAQLDALRASPTSTLGLGPVAGHDLWPELTGADSELAGELLRVFTKLVRSVGRREAMRLVGCVLAAVGLTGLDTDECTRIAQALAAPRRVDAKVVENLAVTLARCKRLEDKLGPGEVLDTVVAQHGLVRRLLLASRIHRNDHLAGSLDRPSC
ncbi:MAG: helix-turn-helix domain-containing protein [Pseudonocardiaceae bacterium]